MHKEKYKKLAEQFGMTTEEIRKICESQFEFTKEVMQTGEDQPVRLQYLGKFMVKEGRRETIAKRRRVLKKNRDEEGRQEEQ